MDRSLEVPPPLVLLAKRHVSTPAVSRASVFGVRGRVLAAVASEEVAEFAGRAREGVSCGRARAYIDCRRGVVAA